MNNTKSSHRKIISEFLDRWKHLPEQGSEDWVAARPLKVGGSELYSLQRSMSQVVANKIGLKQIPTMLAMLWGNTFEPVIRNICSIVTATSIHEAGSIPSEEVPDYKNYSMDGMGSVVFRNRDGQPERHITLFEFKCLYSRKPVPGEIPQNYQPQIKSGLCDLGITQTGLFVEAVFRMCSVPQLGYGPERTTALLTRDYVPKDAIASAYGMVGVYTDALYADTPYALAYITEKMQREKIPDYGMDENLDYGVLEYIMKCMREGRFQSWYSRICMDGDAMAKRTPMIDKHGFRKPHLHVDMQAELDGFVEWTRQNGKILVGVIPWKLFDINMVAVEKEPGYTLQHEPLLRECITTVKELLAITDLAERYAEYNRRFHPPTIDQQNATAAKMLAVNRLALSDSDSSSDDESDDEPDDESDQADEDLGNDDKPEAEPDKILADSIKKLDI